MNTEKRCKGCHYFKGRELEIWKTDSFACKGYQNKAGD